jgi:pimeloyl-ACP methyl ester carboxylesterase
MGRRCTWSRMTIPDGGHYLPEEQPEAVAAALPAFAVARFGG